MTKPKAEVRHDADFWSFYCHIAAVLKKDLNLAYMNQGMHQHADVDHGSYNSAITTADVELASKFVEIVWVRSYGKLQVADIDEQRATLQQALLVGTGIVLTIKESNAKWCSGSAQAPAKITTSKNTRGLCTVCERNLTLIDGRVRKHHKR